MKSILEETGLSVAYDHFSKKDNVEPPFILYKEDGTDNFIADDKTYQKFQNYQIFLITKIKDKSKEEILEQVLENHNIPFNKTSENYIYEENIYQINYEI